MINRKIWNKLNLTVTLTEGGPASSSSSSLSGATGAAAFLPRPLPPAAAFDLALPLAGVFLVVALAAAPVLRFFAGG